jgi:hypothetical protein
MVGKALEMWRDSLEASVTANEPSESELSDNAAAAVIEAEMLRRGDDGLLEYLRDVGQGDVDGRLAAVRGICGDLLDRRLYKPIARSDDASRALAAKIYATFGGAAERRALEVDTAQFARLDEGWQVLLWIPSPDMRLKAAGVLVHDGQSVLPLHEFDKATLKRGTEIYDSHQALWAVSIYVSPLVPEQKHEVIRRRLAEKLGVTWAANLEHVQPSPLIQLAAAEVAGSLGLTSSEHGDVMVDIAASGAADTYESLVSRIRAAGEARIARRKPS